MNRKKISFSGENRNLDQIFTHDADVAASLALYFSEASPFYESRFVGLNAHEVDQLFRERLEEQGFATTMSILAAVEAAFRIDYLKRCYRKMKDALSLEFRDLYSTHRERVSLEDDILQIWKKNTDKSRLLGELKGAFKFRHWLAHGRFWEPKLGQKFDVAYIYQLALAAFDLPLKT